MAYGTLADWRTYANLRGNTTPTITSDPTASAALERASDYIRTRFVRPYSMDGTDPDVVEATYIIAAYELDTPNLFNQTFGLDDRVVLTKVEGIQWTPLPGSGGSETLLPMVPAVEALLRPEKQFGPRVV